MSLRQIQAIAKRYKQAKGQPAPSVTGLTLRAIYGDSFVWIDAHKGEKWKVQVQGQTAHTRAVQVCDSLSECQEMLDRHLPRKNTRSKKA